ncbi:MAG: site-2 protease family protein [Planctomycetota bacterium]
MHNRDVWSLSLGRWKGLHVRLHIFFVLFGVFTGYLASQEISSDDSLMWLAVTSIFILLVSVLIHELGHYFATMRLGGHMDAIVLGPLGGLKPPRVPSDPQSELLCVLAGPAATLATCIVLLILSLIVDPSSAGQLLDPLAPTIDMGRVSAGGGVDFGQIVRLGCWINWWLFIVNLIPAFPFDGGRAFSSFLQVIRPQIDSEKAVGIVATFARLVAIALFVAACILGDFFKESSAPPAWLGLLLLSVFVFFSARVEETQVEEDEPEKDLFGYDFSQGYTSLEKSAEPPQSKPGPITRWLERRREQQRRRQLRIEAEEDQEADRILERLHEHGMESLSPRERALLKRVSVRYRTREQNE